MVDARDYATAGVANGRQPALGTSGMVSSPHPFATIVGLDVLRAGGNAVDAALAVSAALMVAAPHQCGPGGDAWWHIAAPGEEPTVLNASGESGSGADPEVLRRRGLAAIPLQDPSSVTVPGAVAGWREVQRRFGMRDLPSLLEPAIRAAIDGLPVTPNLARRLAVADALLASRPAAAAIYRPNGRALRTGELLVLPDLAGTLERIAADPRSIYEGELAARIARAIADEGGWVTEEDLAASEATWVPPVAAEFGGWTIWEAPPNSQGIAALIALEIVTRLGVGSDSGSNDDAHRQHRWIEAARISLAVRDVAVADPREMRLSPAELLDSKLVDALAALVRPTATPEAELRARVAELLLGRGHVADDGRDRTAPEARPARSAAGGDTVHFAVVDRHGLAVSCIQSLFVNFGTGIAVPGTGILLQNRGSSFTLEAGHPNQLRPRRRPLHTLTPGIATEGGSVVAVFGSMGGHAQTQLHLQMLDGIALDRLDPATVTDRPRWFARVDESGAEEVILEARSSIAEDLRALGHPVRVVGPYDELLGHEQIVTRDPARGILVGAADPRTDGLVLGH